MSDLLIALIILGALIIAAVVVYNWMQEKKLRKQVSGEFIVPQKDVLADDFYIDADAYVEKELSSHTSSANNRAKPADAILAAKASQNFSEPALESPDDEGGDAYIKETIAPATGNSNFADTDADFSESSPSATNFADATSFDEAEPIVKAAMHEQLKGLQANLPEVIHQQVDLIAVLYATKNIAASDLETLKTNIADMGLPMLLHGLDADDKWHLINDRVPKINFKQVACSLQLADRGGPVAKNLLNKFQYAVEDAGLNLNAHVEWQGNGDALQRAIELDQFCIEVDQLISVHLAQTDTPIHGTKLKGLAEASGLTLMADGKFHCLNNSKQEPLFVLIDTNNQALTAENLRTNVLKSVTFQIEIPKVTNCEQVFNQMIGVAQKMASSLNGQLVDDNQKPLGDIQIEKIRQQLRVIHATMVARGIMPGSPASMRLFS
jgi:FtsZ-interacting cell division protein ZipA